MKKIFAVAALILVSGAMLFAAGPEGSAVQPIIPSSDGTYSAMVDPFQPLTARALAMGGAGVAVTGRSDTFYINPASLASRRFQLSIPSAQVTLYHVYDLLETGVVEDLINGGDPMDSVGDILESIDAGKGKIADVDAGLSFTAGGFGLGINARASVLTYGNNVGGLNAKVIGKVNAAASIGYGYRFNLPADFSIDLGVMVRFNYLAYTEALGASEVSKVLSESGDPMELLNGTPIMAGYSIPVDVGLNINMPAGFSLGAVARNLNGKYHMTAYESYEGLLDNPFGGPDATSFTFDSDWSLDAGIGWSANTWYLSPTLAVDVRDIIGLSRIDDVDFRDFMYHLNVGAELRLLSFLDLRGGLNQGYWTLGVGLDLWAVKVDISYFHQEFGVAVGDNGLDGLTVRVNIGFDR